METVGRLVKGVEICYSLSGDSVSCDCEVCSALPHGRAVLVQGMRMRIPSLLLTKLYVKGSLRNECGGFLFSIKNVLTPGTVVKLLDLSVDGRAQALGEISLLRNGVETIEAVGISSQAPLALDLGREVSVQVGGKMLSPGPHLIVLSVLTAEVGQLRVSFRDTIEGNPG